MATVIMDRGLAEQLRQQRAASGADRWDEVWEGTYMMSRLPNIEHQDIASSFVAVLRQFINRSQATILGGANVSDREDGWKENFRCPDVVVYYKDNPAKNCNTHWCGGADFAVEIVSEDDRIREKIPFYAQVNTRELLIVDRAPWQLELLRLDENALKSVGTCSIENGQALVSEVLQLTFRLISGVDRPTIRAQQTAGGPTLDI